VNVTSVNYHEKIICKINMTTDYKLISTWTSVVCICHFAHRQRQNKKIM